MVSAAHVRSRALLIAAVTFISYAYFYEGGGWNQNSRFDLVRAITQEHTLRIDEYHQNTQDKAFDRGHYYSDKAPGVALLAEYSGWSYGPRYLSPGLPLVCLGLSPVYDYAPPVWRRIAAGLAACGGLFTAACGGLFTLMAVATTSPLQ